MKENMVFVRATPRECGGGLAISTDQALLRIGVAGRTEKAATRKYFDALASWEALPAERELFIPSHMPMLLFMFPQLVFAVMSCPFDNFLIAKGFQAFPVSLAEYCKRAFIWAEPAIFYPRFCDLS